MIMRTQGKGRQPGQRLGLATRTLAGLAVAAATACAGPTTQVRRLDTTMVTDLSGGWNDTDSRLTAEGLIGECFASDWLPAFAGAHSRKPAVRVRGVANKSDEHIDAQVFIKNIERAMIHSGKVTVLAQEGGEITAMEGEQLRAASGRLADASRAALGHETGADYVVAVRIASVLDEIQGAKAKLYQVDFELIGASSGEKVWIGEHQIKKMVTQGKSKW